MVQSLELPIGCQLNTASRASVFGVTQRRSSSSHSRLAKKLSAMASSQASPTDPIDARTPMARQRWPKAMLAY